MAKNELQWSSATPGLIIILLDQSGSMLSNYYDGDSRTEFSAKVINRVISDIINKNFNKDKPKNRCFITVIGYSSEVKELCSGYLEDLYNNPIRIENITKKVGDSNGGLVDISIRQPIWIEPITENRWTNMRDAFKSAKSLVEKWISDKPECPAPVIINVSDGIPYYDNLDVATCIRETTDIAKQIMNISNKDGNVLIFNAEIGDGGYKVIMPSTDAEAATGGPASQFLYEISSVIPEGYKSAARKNELSIKDGSRGCVFNADAVDLIKLINFGSSKGMQDNQG